jgi:hypothetical protein
VSLDGRSPYRGDSGFGLRLVPPRTHQVGWRLLHVVGVYKDENRCNKYHLTRTPQITSRRLPIHAIDPPKLPLIYEKMLLQILATRFTMREWERERRMGEIWAA